MDKCVIPFISLVFANPVMLPFTMLWAETLKSNPMGTDENQDVWDGRVRHFETRLNELATCTERTERRVGEQIAELSSGVAQMRGQMDEITAALRILAAQKP